MKNKIWIVLCCGLLLATYTLKVMAYYEASCDSGKQKYSCCYVYSATSGNPVGYDWIDASELCASYNNPLSAGGDYFTASDACAELAALGTCGYSGTNIPTKLSTSNY